LSQKPAPVYLNLSKLFATGESMKKLTLSLCGLICLFVSIQVQAQVTPDQARNYQINETHTGSSSSPGLIPPLREKWNINFGRDMSYPLIADGKVFVTVRNEFTYGTTLYALNAVDGATLWSFDLAGSTFWSALCYENGRVFTLNWSGTLRAFNATTGGVVWSLQLPGSAWYSSAPTVSQGVLYTSSSSTGKVYAVSAATGAMLWNATVNGGDQSSPAVTTDGVYVSYSCPNVYKLNPANGAQIWKYGSGCFGGGGRTPALYNGRLYVRNPNPDYIFDSQTGGMMGGFVSKTIPAFSGNKGFFLNGPQGFGTPGVLEARDVNSNIVLWTFAGDGFLQSSILVVNDYVYIGSNSGKLYALDAATGNQVWSTTAGPTIPYVDEQNLTQPLTGFAAGEGILVIPTRTTLVAYETVGAPPTITWDAAVPPANADGWNNTPVQLSFTAVAHPSGPTFSTPGSPLLFNSEGINQTQQVTVTDQANHSATFTSPAVKIDLTAPITDIFKSGTVAGGGGITAWYKSPVQVTLVGSDSLSGVRTTFYLLDGGATQTYTAPFSITGDGTHSLLYWSTDAAGNSGLQRYDEISIDATAPATVASVSGTPSNGWYGNPAQVSLTASDATSQVANTFYTVDGGPTQTYASPFSVSGEGNHLVTYWSADVRGNTETAHSLTVKIDASAPTTQLSIIGLPPVNGWYIAPFVRVALSPTDSKSGVAATYYSVNGGAAQTYTGYVTLNASAIYQVSFWSVDNVGNAEVQHTSEVKIDNWGPVTQSQVSGQGGGGNYYRGPVQVSLTATDDASGVANIYYQIDGGPTQTYTAPFTVSGDGTHPVHYWSVDVAGNSNNSYTIQLSMDATAPATQAALSGTAGANGWYSTAVQVTLTATDNASGLGYSYYAVDGGLQQTYAGPFTISTTGSHTLLYWSKDVANNVEAQHSVIIKVDVGSPATTASVNGTLDNGWYQGPAQVTLTAADSASGVANTFYTIDGGATQTYASPFNITADGTHSIKFWSVDAVGNSEPQQSLTVQVDSTAPTTVISPGGTAGNNGWYSSSVTVSLTASDNNQSGVATTYYSVDGGVTQTYAAPFTFSYSGTRTIVCWSVDGAGNTESQQSMIIKIDLDTPSTQAQVSAAWWYDVWYQSPAQVSFTRLDVTSGVATTYYTVDGGATQTYTDPVNISAGGIHTVNYWSVDNAGNAEAQKSVTVRVDNTAPGTQISTGGIGANGWYRSAVQVSLNASDSEVGVNVTMYRVDGGPTMVYSGPFTVSGDGQHQVLYWSNDKLSNTETQQTATIRIDSTVPTAQNSVSGPVGGNGYYKGAVQFTMTSADNLSGIANNYYRINGGATQPYSSPFAISSDGNYAVDYWSVDLAGNVSGVGTATFKIDASAPLTQATGSGTAGTNGWYRSAVQVSLAASDNLSGVQTTYYKIDGGTTRTYTVAFSVSGNGSHTINFWSLDKATNTETTRSLAINIDSNTPSVTTNVSPSSANKSSNPVTITVTGHATDTVSGVPLSGGATFSVLDEYGVTQPSGPITLQSNGNYSFTLTLPATKNAGDNYHVYTITVVGTDRAGNTNTASDTLKIN
jgi:outer membrane protein assembly factor BamB